MTNIIAQVKRLTQQQLAKRQRVIAHINSVSSTDRLLSVLNAHSVRPETVIDVGVAYGTPWLYEAFSDATFHLVDPTRESLPFMEQWAKTLHATVHNVALGNRQKKIQIRTRDTIISSTLLTDMTKPDITEYYDVDMVRFDSLDIKIKSPCICKIDVEGAELAVLDGMGEQIKYVDVFVIETSLNSLYEQGPEFSDVNSLFNDHGFCLFDIAGVKRRPFDGALHQIDAVYVKKSSPMRVKRWA
jgi:FkbM family methyltransferase